MFRFPTVITHTYHPARGALRNVCALPDDEAERVLDAIRASGTARLRPTYLAKRRATEAWLIGERIRLLGPTPLARPLYFFLGDFADGLDPSRPCALVLPLAAFAPEILTFTLADSMEAIEDAGPVLTLAEVTAHVAAHGLPDRFIEVQVWDTAPLDSFSRGGDLPAQSRSFVSAKAGGGP